MKPMLAFFGALAISSTVFAGAKDLRIMNKLTEIGLTPEGGMSKIHVAIRNPDCGESIATHDVACSGIDLGANGGQEAPIELKGNKAKDLMILLYQVGGQPDEGMGKSWLSAGLIDCQQTAKGVAQGSDADRTTCTIVTDPQ
jgi:hypothetical protein